MKLSSFVTIVLLLAAFHLGSCSSTKEEIAPPPPPPVVVEPPIAVPEKSYTFKERYLVPGAVIAPAREVKDALQALRVIQLDKGENQVLVISSFDKVKEGDKDVAMETWLGIEMNHLTPGVHNISEAVKTQFYRFYLGQDGKRFDGFSYDGTVQVDSRENGFITGSVELVITGMIRSFTSPPEEFKTSFSGSFKIREVNLEDTIMRSK